MWKVKMVRLLTDRVSPDVIVESSFEHEFCFYGCPPTLHK